MMLVVLLLLPLMIIITMIPARIRSRIRIPCPDSRFSLG